MRMKKREELMTVPQKKVSAAIGAWRSQDGSYCVSHAKAATSVCIHVLSLATILFFSGVIVASIKRNILNGSYEKCILQGYKNQVRISK
jgi:hypothetical protein